MTQKILAAVSALLLCGIFTACGGQEDALPSQENQPTSSAVQEESSQPVLRPEPRTAEAPSQSQDTQESEDTQEETVVLTQQDSGAETGYEPTFTLYSDGTFELFATFYDGTATITGTYVQQDGGYALTPEESTAQGVMGSDVGDMTLSPDGEGYAYSGGQLGLIYDGAVFLPSQN